MYYFLISVVYEFLKTKKFQDEKNMKLMRNLTNKLNDTKEMKNSQKITDFLNLRRFTFFIFMEIVNFTY